ncbi:hypothetical protein BD410DRAFT_338043 [Rickenella mellea]|uniref:Uncharacterized protein n=1 Tax=Rickenella mellea TaxID=50990 RepID=A0A4Y7QJZ3_9AGAM|nr:hypothetical protein BD410DRAFT_338043 [Rickenella mellea]
MNPPSPSSPTHPRQKARPQRPLPELPNAANEPRSPTRTPRHVSNSGIPCPELQQDPIDLICEHFNVKKVSLEEGVPAPARLDMPLSSAVQSLPDAILPTHVLAVYDRDSDPTTNPRATAMMIPINAEVWTRRLTVPLEPAHPSSPHSQPHSPISPGGRSKSPARLRRSVLSLPVTPFNVPHASSLPLLLVSALAIVPPNCIAASLLPQALLGELPACPAILSYALAYPGSSGSSRRRSTRITEDRDVAERGRDKEGDGDAHLKRLAKQNSGMWKNVLALGVKDRELTTLVEIAWNITAEAQRLRFGDRTPSRPPR